MIVMPALQSILAISMYGYLRHGPSPSQLRRHGMGHGAKFYQVGRLVVYAVYDDLLATAISHENTTSERDWKKLILSVRPSLPSMGPIEPICSPNREAGSDSTDTCKSYATNHSSTASANLSNGPGFSNEQQPSCLSTKDAAELRIAASSYCKGMRNATLRVRSPHSCQ
ncbi:hypothetical protein ACMFMF_008769 [Clarireedia jacksonii]